MPKLGALGWSSPVTSNSGSNNPASKKTSKNSSIEPTNKEKYIRLKCDENIYNTSQFWLQCIAKFIPIVYYLQNCPLIVRQLDGLVAVLPLILDEPPKRTPLGLSYVRFCIRIKISVCVSTCVLFVVSVNGAKFIAKPVNFFVWLGFSIIRDTKLVITPIPLYEEKIKIKVSVLYVVCCMLSLVD